MSDHKVIVDYENLLRARRFRTADARRAAIFDEIRADVSGEYNSNLDQKIERWIDVTRTAMWKDTRSVRCYIQAKMLYRDAFYEAAIMAVRSVCELVCYELLAGIAHPFGEPAEVERINFRKLVRFVHDQGCLPDRSFELLNNLYDIGNNYVHPKSEQSPKVDARNSLLFLGEVLWGLYGTNSADLRAGITLETAYSTFTDICSSYHFWVEGYASSEAASHAEFGVPADEEVR